MLTRDILIEALTSCGWEPVEAAPGSDARLVLGRSEGRVEIDHRPARRELWLTLSSDGDKRILQLRYGDAIDVVVDKLVAMQNELALERHEANLRALEAVCEVAVSDEPGPRKFFSMELQLDDAMRAQLDALSRQRRN